jgi:hypothetical protein
MKIRSRILFVLLVIEFLASDLAALLNFAVACAVLLCEWFVTLPVARNTRPTDAKPRAFPFFASLDCRPPPVF